ncbi:hypothetical protein N8600_10410 [Gammaproteobacteria bacterium]|nr:hypothetical protein [Gammaproteobacteria bacterium]
MKKDYKLTLFFAMSSIAAAFGQHATAQVFEDGEELHPTIANTTAVKGSENTYLIDDDGPRTPTPRLADGTPDLSGDGYWDLPWVSNFANARDVPREAPWRPWVKSMWEYHTSNDSKFDPEGFCLPPGGPRAFATPYPAEIVQHKDRILIIFEGGGHVWREIFMDGREQQTLEEVNPTYFGHSVGHWEGDTLMVGTIGYNEKTWLDYSGTHHTDQLRTTEYMTRPYKEKLNYRIVIDDPGAFYEPWEAEWDIPWSEGTDMKEYICQENNQFMIDLEDDFDEPFFPRTEGAD